MVGGVKNSLGGYLSPAELEPGRFGKYPVTYSIFVGNPGIKRSEDFFTLVKQEPKFSNLTHLKCNVCFTGQYVVPHSTDVL